jgi:hypothetical protein
MKLAWGILEAAVAHAHAHEERVRVRVRLRHWLVSPWREWMTRAFSVSARLIPNDQRECWPLGQPGWGLLPFSRTAVAAIDSRRPGGVA